MSENNYAMIRDGVVENITTWNGSEDWQPPEDVLLVAYEPTSGIGVGWLYQDGEFVSPYAPQTFEELVDSVELDRQIAYRETSDPLFFEWQRGTGTEQEWLDAVQAVKDAHPYPDVP